MANIENMKRTVQQMLEAFCKGDWDAYKQCLTDDAFYEEEATGRRVQGGDQIVQAIATWKRAFPDVGVNIKDLVASGDAIVAELEWSGTHTAPLEGPMGTLPPTNKSGKLPAVEVVRFEGDRIRDMRHYFDLLTLLRQLGVAPQMGAPAPSAG